MTTTIDAFTAAVGALEVHREHCTRCRRSQPCPEADGLRTKATQVNPWPLAARGAQTATAAPVTPSPGWAQSGASHVRKIGPYTLYVHYDADHIGRKWTYAVVEDDTSVAVGEAATLEGAKKAAETAVEVA